jgi:translation initiation factor 1
MAKKNNADKNGFVYSTDPNFSFNNEEEDVDTLAPSEQKLRIWLDSKRRAGKTVTLITGFVGKDEDLQALGKQLKNTCGTGGNAKDGEIIIQGDQREKIFQWLQKNKYTQSKKAGT